MKGGDRSLYYDEQHPFTKVTGRVNDPSVRGSYFLIDMGNCL
jgi:hypothetical protein